MQRTQHRSNFSLQLLITISAILVLSACTLSLDQFITSPPTPSQPTNGAEKQSQGESEQENQEPATPTDTTVPDTPTPTPSPTATLTPTFTLTPTLYAEISKNTNCRFGPGSVYDLLHTYLSGQEVLLLGKNANEDFFYSKDGNGTAPDCWLWAKYATPVGDTSVLPIFTPPPTPTPYLNFSISYQGSDCGAGSCWLWFQINNTGTLPFESVKVYAKNKVTGADATYNSNLFQTGIMGGDVADIPVSGSGYTHTGQLPNPGSDKVAVSVKVCSANGQGGICLTQSLTVTP